MHIVIPVTAIHLHFLCPRCNEHKAECSPNDLNLCGTPQCPECDDSMGLLEDSTVEVMPTFGGVARGTQAASCSTSRTPEEKTGWQYIILEDIEKIFNGGKGFLAAIDGTIYDDIDSAMREEATRVYSSKEAITWDIALEVINGAQMAEEIFSREVGDINFYFLPEGEKTWQ